MPVARCMGLAPFSRACGPKNLAAWDCEVRRLPELCSLVMYCALHKLHRKKLCGACLVRFFVRFFVFVDFRLLVYPEYRVSQPAQSAGFLSALYRRVRQLWASDLPCARLLHREVDGEAAEAGRTRTKGFCKCQFQKHFWAGS